MVGCQSGVWHGQGIGSNQTWQNVIASRATNTWYTNTTGKPINISARIVDPVTYGVTSLYIDGVERFSVQSFAVNANASVTGIIPIGSSYLVSTNGYAYQWSELR